MSEHDERNDDRHHDHDHDHEHDEVDADLLTLARDLGGQMKRRTDELRIAVPPVETIVVRSRATARRSRLLVAAAVIAVVVLAAGVIRLIDRPQSIDVGRRDDQQTSQPVTLDPSSGWRISTAFPGDPGASVSSGLPYFASGPDGWPSLLIMPQAASSSASAPTATDPVFTDRPAIAVAEPKETASGGLEILAVLEGGLPIAAVSYGLSREQLLTSLRGMTATPATPILVVPGLPDTMHETPFGPTSQFAELSTDGIATGTVGTTIYLTQVRLADIKIAAAQRATLQSISSESLATRTSAGRPIAVVRSDTNLVVATAGPEAGTSIVIWAPARLDDAAVDQIVGAIRPLSLDEWHGLQERCPPPSAVPDKPCS